MFNLYRFFYHFLRGRNKIDRYTFNEICIFYILICNSVFRDPTNEFITALKTSIDEFCKFKISFDKNDLDTNKKLRKIMIQADNGNFLSRSHKNVIVANSKPVDVCKHCQFHVEFRVEGL